MCSKDREKSLGYLRIAKRCSNSLNGSLKEIQTHAKCIWKGNFNPTALLGNLAFGKCVNLSLLMFLMKREHQIGVMLSEPQSCALSNSKLLSTSFPSLPPSFNIVMFGLFSTCVYITMLTICLSIVVTATENSPFPSRVHHSQKSMIAVVESSVSIAFLTGSTI